MPRELDLFKFSSEEFIGISSFPVILLEDSKSHPTTYPNVTASTPAHTTAAAATAASKEHGDIYVSDAPISRSSHHPGPDTTVPSPQCLIN